MCPYNNCYLSITSKSFVTHRIKVDRGVTQGDCLSLLLLNLCIKTLVNIVKNEDVNCFGYAYDFSFKPFKWFQIAYDTAIITIPEEDNQLWINCFIKYCIRADLSGLLYSVLIKLVRNIVLFI